MKRIRPKNDPFINPFGRSFAKADALTEKQGVTVTETLPAWLLSKGRSLVAGAAKRHHVEGARKSDGADMDDRGISLLGRTLCASHPGRRHGTEYTAGKKGHTFGQQAIL